MNVKYLEFCINPSLLKWLLTALMLYFSSISSACEINLKVVTSSHWPPYFYKQNNEFLGVETEILNTIVNKTPFCIEFVELPSLHRALEELKNKRVDLLVAATFKEERTQFSVFSKAYRSERIVIFESKYNKTIIGKDNYLHLINHRKTNIAVHRGSVYGDEFEQFLRTFTGHKVETTLAKQRFKLLKMRRVDYALEDELAGLALSSLGSYRDHIQSTKHVVFENDVHYMISLGLMTPKQIRIFNRAIEDSRKEIAAIIQNSSYNPQ